MRSLFHTDSEMSVIGSILMDADAYADVAEAGVSADSFFDPRNSLIFSAVVSMVENNQPIDAVTVSEWLEGVGRLVEAGGVAYMGQVMECTPTTVNAGAYARVVESFAHERLWLQVSREISEVLASNDYVNHEERMGKIQQLLMKAEKNDRNGSIVEFKPAVKHYVDVLDDRINNPGIHGLLTGFEHVDNRLQGIQEADLGIVAGRPGMGKTAYILNILKHVAMKQKKNGMIFSLEMPTGQLVQRMAAAEARVKLGLLKSGKIDEHEESMTRFGAAITNFTKTEGQIFFDDTGGLMISELVARVKRYHRKHGLSIVIVDHIGLVESAANSDNETARVSEVTRTLKKLAKEIKCPVIGLAQLNREVEKRANKRPLISDLRSSGSIEQDADWIQLLYRDDYYNEDSEYAGQVEVISGKLRDGEPGVDYLKWRGEYSLLEGMKEGERYEAGQGSEGGYL